MNWFKNLKIGTKLISGFIMVAMIAGAIGVLSIVKMKQIEQGSTLMYERVTIPLSDLSDMSTSFQRMRINLRMLTATEN